MIYPRVDQSTLPQFTQMQTEQIQKMVLDCSIIRLTAVETQENVFLHINNDVQKLAIRELSQLHTDRVFSPYHASLGHLVKIDSNNNVRDNDVQI